MSDYLLPIDTAALVEKNISDCDNNYLLLNKYIATDYQGKVKPDLKKRIFANITKAKDIDSFQHHRRSSRTLQGLQKSGFYSKEITLTSISRMIVGLGNKGALEVGLSLHPLYGYPYIPSTALKGLCRAWLEVAEDTISENIALQQKIRQESLAVFGSESKNERDKTAESRLGDVLFLDAVPTSFPALEVDIMNPHYGPYYSDPGKNPPGDWYSPVPVTFLTVAPNTEFWFGMASRNKESLDKAAEWLERGLCELGIGAKTSSGYGYFLDPEIEKKRVEEQLRKEEEQRPKWAKEHEQERKRALEADQKQSPVEKIEHEIKTGPAQLTFNNAYGLWIQLPDDKEKLRLAKLFFETDYNYMKGKKKKAWAIEIKKYVDDHS